MTAEKTGADHWQLVPKEPTQEMECSGSHAWSNGNDQTFIYRAMLAASPSPSVSVEELAMVKLLADWTEDFTDDLIDRCVADLKADPLYRGDPHDPPNDCHCNVAVTFGEVIKLRDIARAVLFHLHLKSGEKP